MRWTSRQVVTSLASAAAEWLFAMSPLIVVAIVMAHLGKLNDIATSPEWSFGASVVASQSLVRFVVGVGRLRRTNIERLIFGVSSLLVCVVAPANVILALVIHSELHDKHVSSWLATVQVIVFAVASAVFVLFAATAHLAATPSDAT